MNAYSVHALDWALANLVEDGDEIVALRVAEPANSREGTTPPAASAAVDIREAKAEAHEILDLIMAKNNASLMGPKRSLYVRSLHFG